MNRMMTMMAWIVLFTLFFFTTCFSAPREIVIIRHADKLENANTGLFLSPKGQVRAERFVSYYLKNYNVPDYIFVTRPGDLLHASDGLSMRPVQTIAPLANELNVENKKFKLNDDYFKDDYGKMAKVLLSDAIYKNKMILICWHHGKINALSQLLGVKSDMKKWHHNNYDSVYILKYNTAGELISFQILNNQYPVTNNYTWQQLS